MQVKGLGDMEADKTGRLVVRICGNVVGTAGGWFWINGWCVLCHDFQPDQERIKLDTSKHKHVALLGDFYTGQFTLLANVAKDSDPEKWNELGGFNMFLKGEGVSVE